MKLVSARARAAQLAAQAPRNILCLTVDRLNADFLGAYGNTWIPAFDVLASESILFDSFYATSLDLDAQFRAFWRGESPREIVDELREDDEPTAPGSLFRALKEQGYRAYVVSDAREIAVHPAVEGDYCDGRFFLGEPDASEPASALDETKFYQNFEELARFIAKLEDGADSGDASPWFVWAHFSGWNAAWDFPLEARERYREDEEDPEPYAGAAPPYVPADALGGSNRRSRANLDADAAVDANDLRQSFVEAYAGGISVFDETLGGFTQLLRESGALAKTLFIVAGAARFTPKRSGSRSSQGSRTDRAPRQDCPRSANRAISLRRSAPGRRSQRSSRTPNSGRSNGRTSRPLPAYGAPRRRMSAAEKRTRRIRTRRPNFRRTRRARISSGSSSTNRARFATGS